MPLADYQVNVYSPTTGAQLAQFDSVILTALAYSRVLNGIGALALTVPLSDYRAQSLLALDTIVEVLRYTSPTEATVEETYLVRMWETRTDSQDQDWLGVGGVSLNHLLARHSIDPDDDPLEAGGYSTKGGAADTVMAEYVDEQCGPSASAARQFPEFTVAVAAGTGVQVGGRYEYNDNLLGILQSLARFSQMDFAVSRVDGRAFEFAAEPVGADKTYTTNFPGGAFVVFAPEFGNMAQPVLREDRREEFNHCYLLLRGPDESRDVYQQGLATINDSPFNRVEMARDARQLEEGATVAQLQTQAIDELRQGLPRVEFSFVTPNALAEYHAVWDLGDWVTARWPEVGYDEDLRITAIDVRVTDTETITPKFERVT